MGDTKVVQNFFAAVEANYGGNPYHNSQHAADVSVGVHLFLSEHDLMETRFADPVACLAVLIAGVVHDFAHPGTTNPHEVKTNSVRHKAFGDAGILEKFHTGRRRPRGPGHAALVAVEAKSQILADQKNMREGGRLRPKWRGPCDGRPDLL